MVSRALTGSKNYLKSELSLYSRRYKAVAKLSNFELSFRFYESSSKSFLRFSGAKYRNLSCKLVEKIHEFSLQSRELATLNPKKGFRHLLEDL